MEISLENLNVLYVEDSITQAIMLKEILEKNKLHVDLAKDGLDALRQLQEKLPNIIISDIEMPRMNGYSLCQHVKTDSRSKDIPVILLTNLTDILDVIKGIECGADSFLTKPCDSELLFTTIRNALKNRELENDLSKGKLEFFFDGKTHALEVDKVQITKLLLSTYSNAIQKNLELEEAYRKLNRVHEELEKHIEKLKELNEQKNQFLGMAAHDLRNPLTVISGFSSYLLNVPEDSLEKAKMDRMFQHIYDASNYMLQIIDSLLDFSVIESGKLSLNMTEIDLIDLVQKNVIFFESIAEKKNVKLDFKFDMPLPKVTCDANKVVQILNNIIMNAIKFSQPKGEVKVSLKSSDSGVIISIKDSGIGIAPEAIKNLFQPFTKMKTLGTAGEKGSGLGLAIVYKIVTEHGGRIWVESQLGKGTTFFIELPVKDNV